MIARVTLLFPKVADDGMKRRASKASARKSTTRIYCRESFPTCSDPDCTAGIAGTKVWTTPLPTMTAAGMAIRAASPIAQRVSRSGIRRDKPPEPNAAPSVNRNCHAKGLKNHGAPSGALRGVHPQICTPR